MPPQSRDASELPGPRGAAAFRICPRLVSAVHSLPRGPPGLWAGPQARSGLGSSPFFLARVLVSPSFFSGGPRRPSSPLGIVAGQQSAAPACDERGAARARAHRIVKYKRLAVRDHAVAVRAAAQFRSWLTADASAVLCP